MWYIKNTLAMWVAHTPLAYSLSWCQPNEYKSKAESQELEGKINFLFSLIFVYSIPLTHNVFISSMLILHVWTHMFSLKSWLN